MYSTLAKSSNGIQIHNYIYIDYLGNNNYILYIY